MTAHTLESDLYHSTFICITNKNGKNTGMLPGLSIMSFLAVKVALNPNTTNEQLRVCIYQDA